MTAPAQDPHVVQPPPSDSQLNQRIAEILITAATIYIAAKLIERLLRPFGIGADAILAAVRITKRGSSHKPRIKFTAEGVHPKSPEAQIMRTVNNEDLYFRAAYVVAASHRMQRKMNETGEQTVTRTILADESLNYRRHEYARTQRAKAAMKTTRAAQMFGPLLGWYLNPALNNEAECIAANGNNFTIDAIPLIGLPGAVHVGCGCSAGPPHESPPARLVDQAVASHITFGARPKLLKLKRKAS